MPLPLTIDIAGVLLCYDGPAAGLHRFSRDGRFYYFTSDGEMAAPAGPWRIAGEDLARLKAATP